MQPGEARPAAFGSDVLRTLGTQGLLIVVGVATSVLTARALGPEARGVYALCALLVAWSVWFGSFELAPSQVHHVGRRGEPPQGVLGGLLPLVAMLGLCTFVVLRAAEPLLLRAFPILSLDAFHWAAIAVPFEIAAVALSQFLRARGRIDAFNGTRAIGPLLQLVALAAVFAGGGGLVAAFQAWVVADGLWLLAMLVWVARDCRPDFREAPRVARSLAAHGARLISASAVAAIELRIGGVLVAAWLSAPELAFFAIADGLAKRVLNLPTAIGTVLMPRIAREEDARSAELTAATCRASLFLVALAIAAIAAVAGPAVRWLYGVEYAAVVPPLLLLLPYALGQTAVRTLSPHLILAERIGWMGALNGLALGTHVGLLWWWIPPYGVLGAAAAATASRVVLLGATVAVFVRVTGLPAGQVLRVRGEDLRRMADALGRALRPS